MSRTEITAVPVRDDALGPAAFQRGGMGAPPIPQKNIFLTFWRGRWIVLLCALLGLGGGFLYLSRQTPIYSSFSRILVETEATRVMNTDFGAPGAQTGNFYSTQCEVIQSPQILSSVAELPELRSMKTFADVDNPIGLLAAYLTATPGTRDDLITVTFESPYPDEAATIVNAIVDSYENFLNGRKRRSAGEVLRVLTKEKRDRDDELGQKMQKMLAFKQNNPNLSYAGAKGNVIIDQLAKLSDALTSAHLDTIEAKGAYEASKAMSTDAARMEQWLQLQQGPMGAPLLQEIQRLEIELASLRSTLLPNHQSTKAVEARIDDLHQRIAAQAKESFQAYLAALEQRWIAAQARETELTTSYTEQQQTALKLNAQGTEYAMMESEAARLEKLCDLLDTRIKEVRITESADPQNFTVLNRGKASPLPVRPKRGITLFEALMIGMLVGCGLAYVRELTDHRLSGLDDIESRLGLGVLGVLPHMPGGETISVRGQKVHFDPMSDIAEAYRTIRTAIYFGAPEGKTKLILITSPTPGDGKSTTASNLAIAMAQAGQRVLLMDCDFRKPSQHKVFGIEDGMGLASVVAGQTSLGKAIKPTPTKGLYILPCGPIPRNPSEILNGRAFSQIIAKLQEKFDHIIIDSPPIIAVTDARILGAAADVTIMVLRAQKSTRRTSQHACESMMAVGSRMLGVIVNDVPRRRDGYGYGYRYGMYGYGYGARQPAAKSLEGRTDGAQIPNASVAANGNGNGHETSVDDSDVN